MTFKRIHYEIKYRQKGFILPFMMIILILALIISLGFYQSLTSSTVAIALGNEKAKAYISAEDSLNQIEISIIRPLEGESLIDFANAHRCKIIIDDKTNKEYCQRISNKEIDRLSKYVKDNDNYNPSGSIGNFKRLTYSDNNYAVFYNIRVQENDDLYFFLTTVISFYRGTPSAIESGFQLPKN